MRRPPLIQWSIYVEKTHRSSCSSAPAYLLQCTRTPHRPECFVGFGYPWFPNVRATGAGGQDITKYWRGNSTDSSGRPYFRLPALNISNRVCADLSEFTNASLVYKPTKVLPWMLPQKIHIPIRCGDDLARGIVKMCVAT